MAEREFAVVGPTEQDRAIRTLVSAFRDDPVEPWLYPEEAQYRRHFPAFIAAFGGAALGDQTVWRLGDFDAVAFWFGPGTEPEGEAVVQVLVETTSDDLHADAFATLAQMADGHPPEPHWYLHVVRRRSRASRARARDAPDAQLPGDRGREWASGVSGDAEPANGAVLRARRVLRHIGCPGGGVSPDHAHATRRALGRERYSPHLPFDQCPSHVWRPRWSEAPRAAGAGR